MKLAIIKLGGSLITHKGGRRSIRRQVLDRLATELAEAATRGRRRILLGHGSGSFGHVVAAEHGVHAGRGGAAGASATQAVARELHEAVLEALRRAGLAVWSNAPSSGVVTAAGRPASVAVEPLERALESGLLAVTYGDVVMDRTAGHAICSTETALLAYARRLRARGADLRNAYWFGKTDGIYDGAGATIPRLPVARARLLRADVGGSADTDVTGGMRHRLDTAIAFAALGVTSWVLDGTQDGALSAALAGKNTGGTRVIP
jgi:isopentenyl phosphate kinase